MSKEPSEFEVTDESGNVFADLGLENAEALQAAAGKISGDKSSDEVIAILKPIEESNGDPRDMSDEDLAFFNLEK
ncbi:hypothetical protein DL239_15190 [Sedimentitalea sp. CY04]|uniref:Uncharacterized protein n=1 Tax=Parasedimentitalea denitrificans TaxID=2211118 RepID=A0ABX0W9I2_9RHOB|nr:hypothetical protein [Sedimentitalea sp. CY04]NIZ62319.1 hypothetical protein [Sedimentitalea sp. CY04]